MMQTSISAQYVNKDQHSPKLGRDIFHFTDEELDSAEKITLPKGLHGLSKTNHFAFLSPIETELKPFKVLYNLEDPAISFIVLSAESFNGFALNSDDKVKVADAYNIELKNIKILYLVRIIKKDDALEMTANLRAPIVVDGNSKLAWQHILESTEFQFDFPLKGLFGALHKHKDD